MKTFIIDPDVKYLEMRCDGDIINKYYELKNPRKYYYTIPDACIDLQFIWKNGQIDAYACGTHLEGVYGLREKNDLCFGVKFQPGIIPAMIGRQVKQLVCSRMKIEDHPQIIELTELLGRTCSFEERIELFEELFPYYELMEETDSKVKYILEKINKSRGCIHISELVSEMGYNQRYMDRVFHDEIGMSIKRFAAIIRIQTAIQYMQENRSDEIYEKLGYYDQSYFIKEFRKYTGMTPSQWVKKSRKQIV